MADRFPNVIAQFNKHEPAEIAKEAGGIYRLQWDFGKSLRRFLWIDTSRGYAPIKMRLDRRLGENEDWLEHPQELTEVSWEKRGDVWVPTSFAIEETQFSQPPGANDVKTTTAKYQFQIDWVSVNSGVNDRLFTYEDFGVPEGTFVADWRTGEPVVTEVIGTHYRRPPR